MQSVTVVYDRLRDAEQPWRPARIAELSLMLANSINPPAVSSLKLSQTSRAFHSTVPNPISAFDGKAWAGGSAASVNTSLACHVCFTQASSQMWPPALT